ncbi:MAG: hypothetical protein SNG35_02450 [Rikenellaceae bacterium]
MKEHNIDKTTIESYLNRISEDKIFADSPRYRGLLHFIVTQSLEGKHIKELNIAAQIYGENFGEDKSDGRVRVYMFNLRKRLDSYYKGGGASDEILFILEKGSYNMQFRQRDNSNSEPQVNATKRSIGSWSLFFLGVLLTTAIFLSPKLVKEFENHYCWDSFIRGDRPTLCILADQIIIQHKSDDVWTNELRISTIKNRSQFYNYMMQNPNDSMRLSNFSLYSKAIPFSLHRLTEWLLSYDKRFTLTPDSNFSYDDINGTNIIYLGQIKTMDASSRLFLKSSKIFSVDQKFIYVTHGADKMRYRARFDNNEMITTEYALVSYMPLEGRNKALFFASNNDIGTMATINKFTDKSFLADFYRSLPSHDSHFNALFKVEGIGRTNITCELIELEILQDN